MPSTHPLYLIASVEHQNISSLLVADVKVHSYAADPSCADLWETSGALGIEIAAGSAADLCDADGDTSPVVALRLAVRAVRLSGLRDRCSHEEPSEQSHPFCRRCGTPLDEAELWKWPAPPPA